MNKIFSMASIAILAFGNISESWAAKTCNCGTTGHESECCWEITEVIKNGVTEKILTISPGTNQETGQTYTNVQMKNYGYNLSSDNISDGYSTSYKSLAPWSRQGVTSVVVENGITRIGNHAFLGEMKIISVDMPSVTSIGAAAFHSANRITSVDMPNVTEIGKEAFWNASALKYVGFDPNKITSWGENVFGSANTAVQNCSADGSGCGSCGDDLIMPGKGCVSSCGAGYADYKGKCWFELPFSKKHWTPAEVNKWLYDDNNTITITFKHK